jgi:hypothetical protein
MKLVTTATALVAALSLFGCATENDGEGGGFTAGLRPAKPSLEDITSSPAQPSGAIEQLLNGTVRNPRGGDFLADPEISSETLKPPFPIRGVCEICDVVVLRDRSSGATSACVHAWKRAHGSTADHRRSGTSPRSTTTAT